MTSISVFFINYLTIWGRCQTFSSADNKTGWERGRMDLEYLGQSFWSLATGQEVSRRCPLVIRGVQQQATDSSPGGCWDLEILAGIGPVMGKELNSDC